MNNVLTKVKVFLQKFRDLFPEKLPQGAAEFEAWSTRIIRTYGFPENDSLKFGLATTILHLGPTEAYKPARFFYKMMAKGAAAQVAHFVMQDLKEKQAAKSKAEAAAAKPPEVTASEVTSNAALEP